MVKRIFRKSRHLEYNSQISSDNNELIRYHIIHVGDKNIEAILNRIAENLCEWGGAVDMVREIKGKVSNSKNRYIFRSYDSNQKPSMLRINEFNLPVKRNRDLYERKSGSEGIENYVRDRFEKII
jgi:hypothetical protein